MMGNSTNNDIMQSFINVLPYLPILFDYEISLSITNTETFIFVQHSEKMNFTTKIGDSIPDGGAASVALKTGEPVVKVVDKEVYGVAFKSYAIPIRDEEGKVIGTVLAAKSLEKRNEVLEMSQNISASLQQISSAIEEMREGILNTQQSNNQILGEVDEATANIKNTDNIIKFVENVSKQTNILGLNAAIEASRAGNAGRGFGVVAEEIRKLSNSSSESIKKIVDVLKNMEGSVYSISSSINKSNSFFETQAANFEEITASMQELSVSAQFLEDLSKKL